MKIKELYPLMNNGVIVTQCIMEVEDQVVANLYLDIFECLIEDSLILFGDSEGICTRQELIDCINEHKMEF